MAEISPPLFMDVDGVYSGDELGLPYRDIVGEGVLGYEDFRVREKAVPNMSVDVGAGVVWIHGDESDAQPQYRCRSDSVVNKAITTAHATLPRIDQVIAECLDATFSGVSRLWRIRVVDGTPTAGATLDNRNGAAALPNNAVRLADVLVAAADTAISDAEIRDRRPLALDGTVPPLLTDLDMVFPRAPLGAMTGSLSDPGGVATPQGAVAFFLPRRIVGATKIRWKYIQQVTGGGNDLAGNYRIAIYDASGRKIVETASTAFVAGGGLQTRSEAITATTFEAGWYYALIGHTVSAGIGISFAAFAMGIAGNTGPGALPNLVLKSTDGGVTAPDSLLGLTDASTIGNVYIPHVPIFGLSVG